MGINSMVAGPTTNKIARPLFYDLLNLGRLVQIINNTETLFHETRASQPGFVNQPWLFVILRQYFDKGKMKRRRFIFTSGLFTIGSISGLGLKPAGQIMTVNGPISANHLGTTLSHEHILVDFTGAKQYDPLKWDRKRVAKAMLPYLMELEKLGCASIIEFTPNYLGRDPLLLKDLSDKSGLNIITNTGLYGAYDHKYLPEYVTNESPQELANRWIDEYENGIDGTVIRPGFIKISVNSDKITDVQAKLVEAATITHLNTGLTIASHTGLSVPAFEQLRLIQKMGVHGSALVWVHAQNEKNKDSYLEAASQGVWIGLDGLQIDQVTNYVEMIKTLRYHRMLNKLLVSQDAGWYEPGKPWNGPARTYTAVFKNLIPSLIAAGFTSRNIKQIFEINPREAFSIKIKKI